MPALKVQRIQAVQSNSDICFKQKQHLYFKHNIQLVLLTLLAPLDITWMKIRRVVRYTNTVPTLVYGWISPRFWNHLVQQQQRYSYSTILQCLTYSQLIIHCWKLSRSVTQHFCASICVFAFLDHSFTAQIYLHWSPLSSTNLGIWTKANRTRIFNFEFSVTVKYRYKFISGYPAAPPGLLPWLFWKVEKYSNSELAPWCFC